MSTTVATQQTQQAAPPPKPVIARLSFLEAVSFAGTVMSVTSAPRTTVLDRLGSSVSITPARIDETGAAVPLKSGEACQGFRLQMERKVDGKSLRNVAFVPLANISEISYS